MGGFDFSSKLLGAMVLLMAVGCGSGGFEYREFPEDNPVNELTTPTPYPDEPTLEELENPPPATVDVEPAPDAQPDPGSSEFSKEESRGPKPQYHYTALLQRRFGEQLNKGRSLEELGEVERTKWTKIYAELRKVADVRLGEARTPLLFLSKEEALARSKAFEETGKVSELGAWSIAIEGTAKRHGFEKVPCAEFMSEVIRQAYQRAGYNVTDDFNKEKGNPLIYTHSALVTNLGRSLVKAGWSVWDASQFRPPIGAVLIHTQGISPSHTYMAGGDDGSIIIDNGSPKGLDLRKQKEKTLNLMYRTGGFFLPPGQKPQPW